METYRCGFFFANTIEQFDSVFGFVRSRFAKLYDRGGKSESKTFGKHFYFEVRDNQESRILNFHRLAVANNMSVKEIKSLNLYEYHLLLNDMNEQVKRQKKATKKTK